VRVAGNSASARPSHGAVSRRRHHQTRASDAPTPDESSAAAPRPVAAAAAAAATPLISSSSQSPARSLSDPLLFRSTLIVRMEIASSPAPALSARP